MVKSDNLAPQKARLNFHQGILNSMLFNLFRPMLAITIDDRCLSILNNINLEKMKVRGGGGFRP